MGTGVGADEVGDDVGVDVGKSVGRCVGKNEGEDVGIDVGKGVGSHVGNRDGSGVGSGDMVGTAVGSELMVGRADGIWLTDGAGLIVGNDVSIVWLVHHWTSLSAVQLVPNDIFPPESEILIEASRRRKRPTETSVSTVATAPGCTLPSICTQSLLPGVEPEKSHCSESAQRPLLLGAFGSHSAWPSTGQRKLLLLAEVPCGRIRSTAAITVATSTSTPLQVRGRR